jgi:hypothetical protein
MVRFVQQQVISQDICKKTQQQNGADVMDVMGNEKLREPPEPGDIRNIVPFEYGHLPESGQG